MNAVCDNHSEVVFVLSSPKEAELFKNEFKFYIESLPIRVFDIETIMVGMGVSFTSEDLLRKYGHTSYQMFKKIYSMLYIDADRFFVLDSEASWISKIDVSQMFSDFFDDPFVVVSEFSSREKQTEFLSDHFDATNHVLGYKLANMPFEHFMWFYTKKTIENFVRDYGSPLQLAEEVYSWEMKTKGHSVGLMETMLLLNYNHECRGDIKYKTIKAEEELDKYLGVKEAADYKHRFFSYAEGGWLGMLEFPCELLTDKNVDGLSNLFKDNHIIVTRCDHTTKKEFELQKLFLGKAGIKILAVSQDHAFLPDQTEEERKKLIADCSKELFKTKLKRNIKRMIGYYG